MRIHYLKLNSNNNNNNNNIHVSVIMIAFQVHLQLLCSLCGFIHSVSVKVNFSVENT